MPVEVVLTREPNNPYDQYAVRADVNGRCVGYLRKEISAQLAEQLDGARMPSFTVCGVIRGGQTRAPHLGCHVWLEALLGDGPAVSFGDDRWMVSWPPYAGEGRAALSGN
jgi:hypothetical protein